MSDSSLVRRRGEKRQELIRQDESSFHCHPRVARCMSSRPGFGKHIPSADVPDAWTIHADDAKLHERSGSRGAVFVFPGTGLAVGKKNARALFPSDTARMEIGTVGALALSVTSSVSIVIVNKYLISTLGFPYVTCLTATHMAVTAVALRFAARAKLLEPKPIEKKALVKFAALNGVSVAFLNLSLGFNSVGFYQMTKLAIIPCTVGIQTAFYAKRFSRETRRASRVALASPWRRVDVRSIHRLPAPAATTCVSQIWTNTMQREHAADSRSRSRGVAVHGGDFSGGRVALDLPERHAWASTMIAASRAVAVAAAPRPRWELTFLVIGKCDAVTYQFSGISRRACAAFASALGDAIHLRNATDVAGHGWRRRRCQAAEKKKREKRGCSRVEG